MSPLSNQTLDHLGPSITVPRYDRSALRAGIVHFGVGNFHRVHLAVYMDRLLAQPGHEGWGICGVELLDSPANRIKAEAYKAQDCLYTVSEFAPDGTAATRVVGAMVAYLHAPSDPEAVLARLDDPATRIVSLTITEGGYNLDETSGEFRLATPDVAHDLAGGPPRTAFGFIVEGLRRRRAAGVRPFTIMSCDNLRHNGDTARRAIVSFAKALDPDLGAWIDAEAAFPNAMVDRIAPQVPEAARARLNERSGIEDAVPALCEDFTQWVMEDHFCDGRPAFETVGAEIREDVVAFEFMKMRILNASHMMLSYPGLLCGHTLVHEAMADPRMAALLDAYVERDVIPILEAPRGVSLQAYKRKVLERFANPAIADQLSRLAFDGAAKIPVFIATTLATVVRNGGDSRRQAFFLACFYRYLNGTGGQDQATIEAGEPHFLTEDWTLIRSGDPLALLRTSPLAKLELADNKVFAGTYLDLVGQIARDGAPSTLDHLLAG